MKDDIDIQLLRETLHYSKDTGLFTWKVNRQKGLIGVANRERLKSGRVQIRVLNKKFLAHRLAFAYVNGYFPELCIDHINGDPSDNRWCNLRECTHAENHQNIKLQSNSTSGYMGVNWHKLRQKWRACIQINGKQIHIGMFKTAEDAYKAYCEAKAKYHQFQPTHR